MGAAILSVNKITMVINICSTLSENGIVWYVGERIYKTSLARFTEGSGNEFFSINIIVGDDDGVYIDGGIIFSLSRLNEYNS